LVFPAGWPQPAGLDRGPVKPENVCRPGLADLRVAGEQGGDGDRGEDRGGGGVQQPGVDAVDERGAGVAADRAAGVNGDGEGLLGLGCGDETAGAGERGCWVTGRVQVA